VHENDGGNKCPPCLLHAKRQHVLETASSGRHGYRELEEANSHHFSRETNAQIWKRSCFAEISEEPSP